MIGRTNSGTGGGGISSNSALLVVYTPLGSTVTATNGSATKASNIGIALSDRPTVEMHLISIGAAQFGTWTVTGTRSSSSQTKTVSISSAATYEVSISYELYLVQNGVAVGGSFSQLSSKSSNSSSAVLSTGTGTLISTTKNGWGHYFGLIDISSYNTLYFDSELTGSPSWCYIGFASDSKWYDNTPTSFVAYNRYENSSLFSRTTQSIDLSSASGLCYFKIMTWGSTYNNAKGTIFTMYNVWLE